MGLWNAVPILLGVLALVVAWRQLRASLYVRRREFEDIYVQRYWDISDRLDLDLRVGAFQGGDLHKYRESGDHEDQLKAMWDYLALCEDQIDLRKGGNVTDEAWEVWSTSISGTVNRYPFAAFFDLIDELLDEADVAEGDRPWEHLREYRRSRVLSDPFTMNQFWRYVTGRRERFRLTPAEKAREA